MHIKELVYNFNEDNETKILYQLQNTASESGGTFLKS